MDFEIGDIVECVYDKESLRNKHSSKHPYLTALKEYEVVDIVFKYGMKFLTIRADNRDHGEFCSTRFVEVSERSLPEIEVLY